MNLQAARLADLARGPAAGSLSPRSGPSLSAPPWTGSRRALSPGSSRQLALPSLALCSGHLEPERALFGLEVAEELGGRVAFLDLDLGSPPLAHRLGLPEVPTLQDVLSRRAPLAQALAEAGGVQVISTAPSGDGLGLELDLPGLLGRLDDLRACADYLVIDLGSTPSRLAQAMVQAARLTLLLVAPAPEGITSGFLRLKELGPVAHDLRLLVRHARSAEAERLSTGLSDVARRFLGREFASLGWLPVMPASRAGAGPARRVAEVLEGPSGLRAP